MDEFQSVATESFVLMLSEARKFGLSLVLANQFLSQIADRRIGQTIFGNVATLVCFRASSADAEILDAQFAPYFDQYDLSNLLNWTACVKTQVGGQVAPRYALRTERPAFEPDAGVSEEVRRLSRDRFGRPRGEVEADIARGLFGRTEGEDKTADSSAKSA